MSSVAPRTRARSTLSRLRSYWPLLTAASAGVLVLVLWVLVNRVEWLGPLVADSLRAVIGKDAVTEIEDIAYSVQDRVNRLLRSGEAPKARWAVPARQVVGPQADAGLVAAAPAPVVELRPLRLKDVGPVHSSWSAPGDGTWLPIAVPDVPAVPPVMFKTLLHPDKNRSWAELFVVAIDLSRTELHLVPGSREPVATEPAAEGLPRPGRIDAASHPQVLGAFNGGFKTEHGGYGMAVGGVTWVAPKPGVCAVAQLGDGRIVVDSWDNIVSSGADLTWWRQTPNCMAEGGVLHAKLQSGQSKKWGATLDGNTVIRRSAIGVTRDGKVLLVGISNHTTARALVDGMLHAGAETVAQLDVNFSYPKFVLFERAEPSGPRLAVALADGFEFSPDEYIRKRSLRDFFFLTPKAADAP